MVRDNDILDTMFHSFHCIFSSQDALYDNGEDGEGFDPVDIFPKYTGIMRVIDIINLGGFEITLLMFGIDMFSGKMAVP